MPDDRTGAGQGRPWHLWVVGGLAVLWNGIGTVLWAGTTFLPDTFLAGMPEAHRNYVSGLPFWSGLTWGLGVVAGVIGAILLLLRNRLAVPALALSLLGAVANTMVYLIHPAPEGFFNPALTMFIIGFALFLLWYARGAARREVP